ncbi:MAG TPA: AraC family ligand binding domain-containing protein [Beutenbergiaceae bacterium]|nr:AraC family ligand binding domain-containing protein [Beutenbergiaceae bacterium]
MKKVTALQEGSLFSAKQMQGASGTAFPGHTASTESVLVVTEGRCIIEFAGSSHTLSAGDAFVVPPEEWHQVTGDPDFTAVHVMPKDIRFDFRERPRA